jgi:hypothetical protein
MAWFPPYLRRCLVTETSSVPDDFSRRVHIDRLACLTLMADPQVEPYHSWLAAQLLDSVRHFDEQQRLAPSSECRFELLCNELTLSVNPLHIHALDLSFFTPLVQTDVPLRYLLSKVINQKCQGRKFAGVALRSICDDNRVARQLQELMLCSLLGNYSASEPVSRPGVTARSQLFELLRDPRCKWLTLLLKQTKLPSVVIYALREQVVFSVEEHPVVWEQIEPLVQFVKFKEIVRAAMAVLRDYVARMLQEPGSALHDATYRDKPNLRWSQEVAFLMQPFDTAILKITYRRPKQCFHQFLLSVSNGGAEGDKEDDGVEDLPDVPRLVTAEEIGGIRALAERLSAWRFGVLNEIVRWLELFRVAPEVVQLMVRLMHHHQTGESSQQRLKWFLGQLKELDPRAFQLLHIAGELIQDAQRVKLIGRLSSTYIGHQIDACQSRFGMQRPAAARGGGGAVLDHLFHFVYCEVCFGVYSLLTALKSIYKQDYAFGLRDAVVDYQTREIFCNRNRHNYRGSCHKQPLKRVLLLGNVLSVNKHVVMLCPQEKCGRPMVVSRNCAITERGRACVYCTQKEQSLGATMRNLVNYYTKSERPRRCAVCEVALCKTADVFLYPYRIFVCRAHHSTTLANQIKCLVEAQGAAQSAEHEARMRAEIESEIVRISRQRIRDLELSRAKQGMQKQKIAKMQESGSKRKRQ